jgi:transposase
MGHDISERLDYVPASLRVIRDMREKLACKPCQGSVSIAPVADKVIEGGMAAEGLLAHVLTSKYIDGLTLTRLNKIYARQGARLAESTLADFVRDTTYVLAPVARHIEAKVLESYFINQDDSGLRVLDRDHPKGIKRGHIWTFVGEARWAAYRYSPDWQGKHPVEFLTGYGGYIQGDGYAGINSLFDGSEHAPVRVGCWMHLRRYFYDALQAGDARAQIAMVIVHDVYELERLAKENAFDAGKRLDMRQERSMPLVNKLREWIGNTSNLAPPKTDLGKAITYATHQWPSLLVPFSDGRLEIDNGEAERRLKVLATGRKNWLFAGSDRGAERAAIALTVLGTAVLQGVDPLAYVTDVLRKIAGGWPSNRIDDLMPATWAEQLGQQVQAQKPAIPRLID